MSSRVLPHDNSDYSTGLHAQQSSLPLLFRPSTTHALRHMLRSNTKCLPHASHTAFRTLLRSSSLQEPRDPLLRVFVIRRLPHDHAHAWASTSILAPLITTDPSAGSPTETLLRLLLPLDERVWACSTSTESLSPTTSPNHPIGSSDGRCVQRAGT